MTSVKSWLITSTKSHLTTWITAKTFKVGTFRCPKGKPRPCLRHWKIWKTTRMLPIVTTVQDKCKQQWQNKSTSRQSRRILVWVLQKLIKLLKIWIKSPSSRLSCKRGPKTRKRSGASMKVQLMLAFRLLIQNTATVLLEKTLLHTKIYWDRKMDQPMIKHGVGLVSHQPTKERCFALMTLVSINRR